MLGLDGGIFAITGSRSAPWPFWLKVQVGLLRSQGLFIRHQVNCSLPHFARPIGKCARAIPPKLFHKPTPGMCQQQVCNHDTVSERLRKWTRNPLGSARRRTDPLGVVLSRGKSPEQKLETLNEIMCKIGAEHMV